jgi:hypothetical protein
MHPVATAGRLRGSLGEADRGTEGQGGGTRGCTVSVYIVVLIWKCHKLTVMQQALLRYYGNATNSLLCNRHCYVTMEMLQSA